MAIILQYRPKAEPAPCRLSPDDGALGQVIIFPGVRIDRYADETQGRRVGATRKGQPRTKKKQRR